ncbi:MAG TPA: hypothetical protein VFT01_04075 [Homoserinimonas sp.]|nr:hypothetical protein [Homoserinimonas sp.]
MRKNERNAELLLQDSDALQELLQNPYEWLERHGLTQQDVECTDTAHDALERAEEVARKANELAQLPLLDALPRLHELATRVWSEEVEVSRIPFGVSLAERPTQPGPIIDDNPSATTGTGSIRCTFGLKCKADVDR